MALTGVLQVTTDVLITQSGVVKGKLGIMQGCFNDLKQEINGTAAFWVGEAGDAHRKLYESKLAKIEEMLARYQEHVTDLEVMAGVYTEGEQAAASVADGLPPSTLD